MSSPTRLVDDLFGDLGRTGLLSPLTSRTRDPFTTSQRDSLLADERDADSSLSDLDFEADLERVVADRQLSSGLTGRQRLEREELDELFAHAEELLETFEAKLLQE